MSLIDKIPLPGERDDFAESAKAMQDIFSAPYNNRLREAQAQEAMGNASKSRMMAKFLDSIVGGNDQAASEVNSPISKQTSSSNQMPMNKALTLAGILRLPTQVVEGNLITPFGTYQVGENKADTRSAERQSRLSEKTLEGTAANSMESLGLNASFNALDKLMQSPNYKNIAGTLEGKLINSQFMGIPTGSMLQSAFPNKFSLKDAKLHGQASVHMGNIITGVASKFKGPFKTMVGGIINNMKPNMSDSIAVQKAKITALKQLSNLADEQNSRIAQYINNKMDPTAAIMRVAQETMPKYRQIISSVDSVDNEEMPESAEKNVVSSLPENEMALNPKQSGASRLANSLSLPKFKSKEEFQSWYKRQPKITRDAVNLHLRSKM
jgi:hypothetical protein